MSAFFRQDPYAVLGLPFDAPETEVKASFRKLALDYHPDRNPSSDAKLKLQRIYDAYEKIDTTEKRRILSADRSAGFESGVRGSGVRGGSYRTSRGAGGGFNLSALARQHGTWFAMVGLGGLAVAGLSSIGATTLFKAKNATKSVEEMAAVARERKPARKSGWTRSSERS
eukprot:TRINITY_DN3659_c0_g1_i4.p1 TRINITY_DN3659_c0_g1~~TRINITY_DN3659_c0_g1_i4.p1  ORF type:complete len:170 (+),score=26.50 TRINITY_DN3659_c0_g1_i4:293-802(+)